MATNLSGPLYVGGVPVGAGCREPQGKTYYVDPKFGSDGNPGTREQPLRTLLAAYNNLRDGYGDGIKLLSYVTDDDSTLVLDAPFTWSKSNCFLEGLCAPAATGKRARIASLASASIGVLFTVSGHANRFENIAFVHAASANIDQTCVSVSGNQNVFINCHVAGMAHSTPAGRANSRSLIISGSDTLFKQCVIGVSSVARNAGNAEVGFTGGAARTIFDGCVFLSRCNSSGAGHVFATFASGSIAEYVLFRGCLGVNVRWAGGGTAMTFALGKTINDVGGVIVVEGSQFLANDLANNTTDIYAIARFDGTDLTTDLGILVTPTNT